VFGACEIIQIIPVICVDRPVPEFDFRLVISRTPDKWRPVERRSCSDMDSNF